MLYVKLNDDLLGSTGMHSGLTVSENGTDSARVRTAESEPVYTAPVQLGFMLTMETSTILAGLVLSWLPTYTRRSEAVVPSSTQ